MDYKVCVLDTNDKVRGEVYKITNLVTGKVYIGQAVTHRKNRGKYRPFGYIGRFKDHVSEALCNTKKKQCSYLNASIRKHGKNAFEVKLLETCDCTELDAKEIYYIELHDSMYPNGYNLTKGGKTMPVHTMSSTVTCAKDVQGNWRRQPRSEETKKKMSERLKELSATPEFSKQVSSQVQKQHLQYKFAKFNGIKIDINNLDQYIHPVISKKTNTFTFYKVFVHDKRIDFMGKHNTQEELRKRAINFLLQLATGKNHSGLDNPQATS